MLPITTAKPRDPCIRASSKTQRGSLRQTLPVRLSPKWEPFAVALA
jgi:hypothetical protein